MYSYIVYITIPETIKQSVTTAASQATCVIESVVVLPETVRAVDAKITTTTRLLILHPPFDVMVDCRAIAWKMIDTIVSQICYFTSQWPVHNPVLSFV